MSDPSRCDLHVHSRYSTDSGNFALRRARLGESYTDPERVYAVCKRRGMRFVTITDHNTLEGALRIAHLPDTFLSVEVTTRFPEDDVPLHVLVWGLGEDDQRELQEYRPSVYELVGFLRQRRLVHALAHPLYRMGPPLTPSHVERMMLLFAVWEGRNGARPAEANVLACRLAGAMSPDYAWKLADRHGLEPAHHGFIGLTGGSDDHGALDIATTFTEAPGSDVETFLAAVVAGVGDPAGEHGSTVKLAHAVGALAVNAYRESGGALPEPIGARLAELLDDDAQDAKQRHREIGELSGQLGRLLGARARAGGVGIAGITAAGPRLSALALSAAVSVPYLATAHHHAGSRAGLAEIDERFFGIRERSGEPRAMVFTDTFDETNGVAGTMRRLAEEAAAGRLPLRLATSRAAAPSTSPDVTEFAPDWTLPLPTYEQLELRFPVLTEVLACVESERPDVIHVATPGPLGVCGLISARLLGVPLVGSYHTELGPYALHLTRDLLVAQAIDVWVDWFYRQCALVLAPTRAIANQLASRGLPGRIAVWGRGVDTALFTRARRRDTLHRRLLDGGELLLLSVGRVSREKRLDDLLEAFRIVRSANDGVRLAIVGDGPARAALEQAAPAGVSFLGELRGDALADVYAAADVFCFPSTTDTFGQVLLEASASALPSVACAAGGATELVLHERTGLLVPTGDATAFAAALLRLVADPGQCRALGEAARVVASRRTWEASHQQLQRGYRSVSASSAVRHLRAPDGSRLG